MEFNQASKTVQLCAKGMELEGQGQLTDAFNHFNEAWSVATDDIEKCTAAHYIARHQKSIADKFKWDLTALQFALNIKDDSVGEFLPSLYLNIAKCHEDLRDYDNAKTNYLLAFSFSDRLPDNGYSNMIKGGIKNGLDRVNN